MTIHDLDLGTIPDWRTVSHQIRVENSSTEFVRIVEVRGSCNCTEISPRSFDIAPGETAVVNVDVDLDGVHTHEAGMTRREVSTTLRFVVDSGATQDATLSGAYVAPYATVRMLNFRDPLRYGIHPPGEVLTVWTESHLRDLELTVPSGEAEVIEDVDRRTASQRFFSIVPETTRMLGRVQFPIVINGTLNDGTTLSPVEIPVSARIEGDVHWRPHDVLLFANQRDGSTPREDVLLWSDRPFEIVAIEDVPEFVAIESGQQIVEPNSFTMHLAMTLRENVDVYQHGQVILRVAQEDEVYLLPVGVTVQPRPSPRTEGESENEGD